MKFRAGCTGEGAGESDSAPWNEAWDGWVVQSEAGRDAGPYR